MIKLTPPKGKKWIANKVGIYICDVNRKATVGILWEQSLPKKLIFEYVHGTIPRDMTNPDYILLMCRTQCVGTLVANVGMWDSFIKNSTAQCLLLQVGKQNGT